MSTRARNYFINQFNTNQFTIKYKNELSKKQECFNCLNPRIKYDPKHDIIWCANCGIVIKQALEDFTPSIDKNYTLLSELL
jgi:ribosomal protein S27E